MGKIKLGFNSKFFFLGWAMIWAADYAQIWQGLTGPAGPRRPGRVSLGPGKRISFNKRAGSGLRVGSRYEKTRPEPDPLPFLLKNHVYPVLIVKKPNLLPVHD